MKNLLDSIRSMYSQQSEATMMQDDGKIVHNCAKHVEHAEWGAGNCITEEHADPDRYGNIAWYDIEFPHGVERGVPVSELKILQAESHGHPTKKAKKVAEATKEVDVDVDETIIHANREYELDEAQKSSGYDSHFKAMMAKHGIKHPGELDTDEKKKAFFNKVDASYKAKNEDVFLEAYMASDLDAVKNAHKKAGNKISDEKTGSKAGQAHHSFVVTTPEGKRTRHIYHGTTKKVETMSAAPRSKQAQETGEDEDDK